MSANTNVFIAQLQLTNLPSMARFPKPKKGCTFVSSNETNPNPLLRPVSRSSMTVESITFPNCEKNSRIDSEVTLPGSPPINNLVARWCSWRGIARFGSISRSNELTFTTIKTRKTYHFAIKEMFAYHDSVYTSRIFES